MSTENTKKSSPEEAAWSLIQSMVMSIANNEVTVVSSGPPDFKPTALTYDTMLRSVIQLAAGGLGRPKVRHLLQSGWI